MSLVFLGCKVKRKCDSEICRPYDLRDLAYLNADFLVDENEAHEEYLYIDEENKIWTIL
jgi:hypothetical protein